MKTRTAILLCILAACGHRPSANGPGSPPVSNAPPDAGPGAAAPVLVQCVAGADQPEFNPYDQARSLEGDDGVHSDACDGSGNLTSYQCEAKGIRCPGGGGGRDRHAVRPCYEQTGLVVSETVDCDGRCVAGACDARCPGFGDELTYLTVGATAVVFDSAADARNIQCDVGFDQKDDYDCANDPRPGDKLIVEGLGMSTATCTGGVWGALSDRRCTYTGCHYVR